MKKIAIKFVGFWPGFDPKKNFIVNRIKKYYEVEFSDNPEYIISSCFSDEYLEYDCIRIFYTGENLCPDFNAFDYAIGFEYMDYGDRYLRFPNYLIEDTYKTDYELMRNKHISVNELLMETKSDFCAFVVSKGNGYVDATREKIFYEISKYKKVNSGGRYLNNIGEPNGVKDKLEFQKKHKFVIACENSKHKGYTTEKIVQAFAARSIPIYWGDSDVVKVFNEKSFIYIDDFREIDNVMKRIRELDQDDNAYLEMLKQPALIFDETLEEQNERLEVFLKNIFEQDYAQAFRRDMVGYGKKHCDHLKEQKKEEKIKIWDRVKYKIKNLIRSFQ